MPPLDPYAEISTDTEANDPYAAISDPAPASAPSWQPVAPVGGAPVAVGPAPDKYMQAAIEDRNRLIAAGVAPSQEGYTRRLVDAYTGGFADDVSAGLRTPIEMFRHGTTSIPEGYRYARAQEDLAKAKTEQNTSGVLGTATDLLGGAALLGNTIGAGTRLARPVYNYLRNIGTGIGIGTISGFGHASRLEDVPHDVAWNAGVGGVLGAAAPAIGAGIKGVGYAIRPFVQWMRKPENVGLNYVTNVMRRSGVSPQQAATMLQEARASGQPFTLGDALGNEGQRAMAAMAKQPGEQRQLIVDAMARNLDMPARVGARVGEALQAPTTAQQAAEVLQQQALIEAAPYYRAAEQVPTYSPRIQEFLNNPRVRQGLRTGVGYARDEATALGQPFDPFDMAITGYDKLGNPIIGGVPNLRTLHAAKMGLDDMYERARVPGAYGQQDTTESRVINNLKNAFVRAIDEVNPQYAQARRIYAGPMHVRDAIEEGRRMATSGRYEDNIRRFAAMSPTEQAGARIGYADAVRTPLERTGNYPSILREKSLKGTQELGAFATPSETQPLRRFLTREEQMIEMRNKALGGSPTAENLADMGEAPGGLGTALNLGRAVVTGHPGGIVRNTVSLLGRMGRGETEKQRVAITRILLAQHPEQVDALIAELAARDARARGVNPFVSRPPRYAPPSP